MRSSVKKAAQRLRRRYAEAHRREVAATVTGPGEVEDELRAQLAALGA